MKQKRLLTVAVLVCAAFLSTAVPVLAQIEAFIMPESDFLRVEGQLSVAPNSSRFSLRLFPNAQITVLWTEGMEDYIVERGVLGTIVTVNLRDPEGQRSLHLAYEGFLDLHSGDPLVLDKDAMWFPEFSIPIVLPEVVPSYPDHWHLIYDEPLGSYPVLVLSTEQDSEFQIGMDWTDPAQREPQLEPVLELELELEPELELELEPEPEPPTQDIPSPVYTPEPVLEHQLPSVSLSSTAGTDSELGNMILRFDKAISTQDEDLLTALVNPDLQRLGLVEYLLAIPPRLLPVESQIKTIEFLEEGAKVGITIYSGGESLYDAHMIWTKLEDTWLISKFMMHPHLQPAPQALLASLEGFVAELQAAVSSGDSELIEEKLGLRDPAERLLAVEFFQKLNGQEPWQTFITNPSQFQLLVLVKQSPITHVVVSLELAPDLTGWRVATFDALPIN